MLGQPLRPGGLDPRAKLLILLCTSIALVAPGDAGGFSWSRTAFAVVAAAMLLGGRLHAALAGFGLLYTAAAVLDASVLPEATGIAGALLAAGTGLVLRVLPGLAIAFAVVRTTEVSAFIAALQASRAPKLLTIPIAVMLRFFPTIAEEHAQIRAALRLRGLSGRGWRHPLRALQWRFVPLLVATTRIGDDLANAALCRGLESPTPRTSLRRVRFGPWDLAAAAGTLALAGWHLAGTPA